ncbi:uncharacterized protein ARMOST_10325 [Armillaria ostoyae]|uniref:Uncharacterized protein n=1 Tax=Armillaria ostoyae TaxID=47428 RepID=A0A284RE10_ARMOS|nr:uncharacterized protein ARMOST_10325 [Armillaria ostoyae]
MSISSTPPNSDSPPSLINLTLSPLTLEYPSTQGLEGFKQPRLSINGKIPSYGLRPSEEGEENSASLPANFSREVGSWLFYTLPNLMAIAQINGTPFKIHPLILEHGYLVISELSTAIMKGLVNVSQKISSVPELITHCVKFNVPFKLAVPASMLHLF